MASDLAFTVLVAARNAAATIARALASAMAQTPARIVLADHDSSDDTVAIAQQVAGARLALVHMPAAATLGMVRQAALECVATDYGIWLDADDELMAGSAARLFDRLRAADAGFAFDAVDLHDGASGALLRRLPMPRFLDAARGLARLFERNYLPGPAVRAFRTAAARAIGFDPALHGAEDFDHLLRAVAGRSRVALVDSAGYRQFAYPGSLSRQAGQQLAMLRVALRKHEPEAVRRMLQDAVADARVAAWALVAFLIRRGDLEQALACVETVAGELGDPTRIIEPGGPWPFPEGWRVSFQRGTLLAQLGRFAEARAPLEQAAALRPSAETCNNLGLVLAALGVRESATALFTRAEQLFPGYADAAGNRRSPVPLALTLLPLRAEPSRHDYAASQG